MDLTTDELTQADQAFAGNRLLSTMSREARALLEPFGEMIELSGGQSVLERGELVRSSLFPVGPTMISLLVGLSGGRSAEAASVGREGAVGGIVSCGRAPAYSQARVLVAGPAFRVRLDAVRGFPQSLRGRVDRGAGRGHPLCRRAGRGSCS